jgi:hypothetical protein
VNQASQLEQMIGKLHMAWERTSNLSDRLYVDAGASTPQLRSLLDWLEPLRGEVMEVQLGGGAERTVRVQIQEND